MDLPFTAEQFLAVFAAYNDRFVVVVVALWIASIATLGYVFRQPATRSRTLSFFMAALWLWNAVAYHALLFTRINPAAWLFALLFAIQAGLFARVALQDRVAYYSSASSRRIVGIGLTVYALTYPWLAMASGHAYPAVPTFGVPCPTAILTIGMLLSLRGRIPPTLAVIPAIWGFIGGSAALLLGVTADYVLLGAAMGLVASIIGQWRRSVAAAH